MKIKSTVSCENDLVSYDDLKIGVLAQIVGSPAWQNIIVIKIYGGSIVALHIPENHYLHHVHQMDDSNKTGGLVWERLNCKFKILPPDFKLTISNEEV